MVNVDAVIITHLHPDHFDIEARETLPKDIPVFVQNQTDKVVLETANFKNVEILTEDTHFHSIRLSKTNGRHGYNDEVVKKFGEVCGVVFQDRHEKTLYLAGDTVWCDEVDKAIL